MLPPKTRSRLDGLARELEVLKKKPAAEIPRAVVVQDGGPKGTRHEGFKDAQVFLRGNHKRPGKTVPRGFPRVLAGGQPPRITEGSGRQQLADWLARPDNPLTARVMVNRIWQHHFGEGLVRTPNDFGDAASRRRIPSCSTVLAGAVRGIGLVGEGDAPADHAVVGLPAEPADAMPRRLAMDPENRLFGRMNRRRLDAEAIRDSLLAVAGRLEASTGGPAFADLAVPRRTLYLHVGAHRPDASASDFGRLFDRADPGSIVGRRGESVVAPQALFFLNDPFVSDVARALAARLAREEPGATSAACAVCMLSRWDGRRSPAEIELGRQLLAPDGDIDPWERYCQVVLSSNEFIYID